MRPMLRSIALILSLSLWIAQVQATTGEEAVSLLTSLYNDKREDCGKPSMPAFLCSGIMLRGTLSSPAYHSWDPSPGSIKSGGVSFSFLRADAEFSKLAYDYKNGYIFYPAFAAPDDKDKVEVLCSFPMDAASEYRDDKGCGVNGYSDASRAVSQSCDLQGIVTAEQWYSKYAQETDKKVKQCGFNVRDEKDEKAGPAFYQSIRASMMEGIPFAENNELRLKTWDSGKGSSLPILAFFYIKDADPAKGLAGARADQTDFMNTTGQFAPVIALVLPSNANQDAQFLFDKSDQAVVAKTEKCASYIQSATWAQQKATGTDRVEWALAVTPTACGREVQQDQTEVLYQELYSMRGQDPQWKDEEKSAGSMRRQLVCLLVNYRSNPTWYIEPFRPYVSHEDATKAGCNPVASAEAPTVTNQGTCPEYVSSRSYWQRRPDPYIPGNPWTLHVVPTECGRNAQPNQTDAFYAELIKKYGQDPQWQEPDPGSMRRQLVCHFVIARPKAEWNLEPIRPNVSHQYSVAQGCNPYKKEA